MDGPQDALSVKRDDAVIAWLMGGDPAIRWQTMRDLLDWPRRVWAGEQRRVATHGWGARLLARQDASGRWTPRLYGQKWISTTYSLLLLRDAGLPGTHRSARAASRLFLEEALLPDGGINVTVTQPRSETCVTGMALRLLSWFRVADRRVERVVEYLLRRQLPDGGWNCLDGARHSSFHTTINVLEGLRDYADAGGRRARAAIAAENAAREFFLRHQLYRSHRTGHVVSDAFTRFSFPPRWHHDILRTLDYFRASDAHRDARLLDPISVVERRVGLDGRWRLQNRYAGTTFFEMERVGAPSRWNTLRALRVLRWWNRTNPSIPGTHHQLDDTELLSLESQVTSAPCGDRTRTHAW